MSPETITSVGVSLATALCGVWAALAARRTPRQERRDDFLAVSDQQTRAIQRLESRVERQEAEAERQRKQIAAQDTTIDYLHIWVRRLAGHIRDLGHEPPQPPLPIPAEVRARLGGIDV